MNTSEIKTQYEEIVIDNSDIPIIRNNESIAEKEKTFNQKTSEIVNDYVYGPNTVLGLFGQEKNKTLEEYNKSKEINFDNIASGGLFTIFAKRIFGPDFEETKIVEKKITEVTDNDIKAFEELKIVEQDVLNLNNNNNIAQKNLSQTKIEVSEIKNNEKNIIDDQNISNKEKQNIVKEPFDDLSFNHNNNNEKEFNPLLGKRINGNNNELLGKPINKDNVEILTLKIMPNDETIKTSINNNDIKTRQEEVSKILPIKSKEDFNNKFIEESMNNEKKYNIKSLEKPNSNNINDQVNNILKSNLSELGDTRVLKLYQSLNNTIKGTSNEKVFEKYPELKEQVNEAIKDIVTEYNKLVLNKNYNVLNSLESNEKSFSYPSHLVKAHDEMTKKTIIEGLSNKITSNNINENVSKILDFTNSKEFKVGHLNTPSQTLINQMKEYNELNIMIDKANGVISKDKIDYLVEAKNNLSKDLSNALNKEFKEIGLDINELILDNKKELEMNSFFNIS